nr:hypothetical protein [Burkholderia ubonensis]
MRARGSIAPTIAATASPVASGVSPVCAVATSASCDASVAPYAAASAERTK